VAINSCMLTTFFSFGCFVHSFYILMKTLMDSSKIWISILLYVLGIIVLFVILTLISRTLRKIIMNISFNYIEIPNTLRRIIRLIILITVIIFLASMIYVISYIIMYPTLSDKIIISVHSLIVFLIVVNRKAFKNIILRRFIHRFIDFKIVFFILTNN